MPTFIQIAGSKLSFSQTGSLTGNQCGQMVNRLEYPALLVYKDDPPRNTVSARLTAIMPGASTPGPKVVRGWERNGEKNYLETSTRRCGSKGASDIAVSNRVAWLGRLQASWVTDRLIDSALAANTYYLRHASRLAENTAVIALWP